MLTHKKIFLFIKRLLFPGLDVGIRKRMKFAKYFTRGDSTTLDVGCGNGAFSFAAQTCGNRVLGIDSDPIKLKRCEEFRDYLGIDQERCMFRVHNAYYLEDIPEIFDQVICFETLEHVKRDATVIEALSQKLRVGGILHLCTPFRDRRPYYGEVVSDREDGNHVRLGYTFDEFDSLLSRVGLTVIQRDTAVGFFSQGLLNLMNWVDRVLCSSLSDRMKDVVHLMLFILYPLTYLDALIPSRQLNIYVAAQKISSRV